MGFIYCFIVTSSYVCSLYLIPSSIRLLPRDNIIHVQYRILASGLSTIVSLIGTYFLNYHKSNDSYLSSIGIRYDSFLHSIFITFLYMLVFYLGPLTVNIIDFITQMNYEISWKGELKKRKQTESIFKIISSTVKSYFASFPLILHYRNLIHAPVTEEIVFRSLMIISLTSSYCNQSSTLSQDESLNCIAKVALYTPIWFAVAHIHHLLEKIFILKQSVKSALLSTFIQITYTSIFGLIASYLYISTGNLASPILSHMICNFIGLPDVGFVQDSKSQHSNHLSYLYPYRYSLIFLHLLGLIIFSIFLFTSFIDQTFLNIHIYNFYN